MMYNLIAGVNKHGIVGQDNDLYVKSSKDLHYFSRVTKGHNLPKQNIVIMGYNTWLSLPTKPLKDRYNIVLSKDHLLDVGDICRFSTIESAFNHVEDIRNNFDEVFIIGGSSVYDTCLRNYPDKLNKLYITEIDDQWSGDSNSKYFNYTDVLPRLTLLKEMDELDDVRIYNHAQGNYSIKNLKLKFKVYQNTELINDDEMSYLNLLDKTMVTGIPTDTRNGSVKSLFGEKLIFNLNRFPLLTTKKMGYKTILRELLWFINGSTDNQLLKDKNVHIWSGNGSKDFLAKRGLSYEEDDLGPIYGFQWRHFGADYNDRYTDYTGKGVDQLKWLIEEIKTNPSSRRLILNAWNVSDLDKMALPPCHILSQYYVNERDGTLSCQLYQRSGDMFLGIPFNIASYALLTCIICKLTGYKPGNLHHIIGDTHIYEGHESAVLKQLKRVPKVFPILTISDELVDIDSITEDMFTVEDYESYGRITAPMAI